MKKWLTLIIVQISLLSISYADFNDLPSTHPAYNPLLYLKEQGAIKGYRDGSVRAENPVTRAELAKILSELRGIEDTSCTHPFKDVTRQNWFYPHVCNTFTKGIIGGYGDNTFRPGELVNFVEASKMILLSLEIPTSKPNTRTWFEPFVSTLGEKNAIPTSINGFDHVMSRGEVAEIIYRLEKNITNKPSRAANLRLFYWPTTKLITSQAPQYRPFTSEDYAQALGNNTIGLYFQTRDCLICRNIDQELTKKFEQLKPNTIIFKVDFEDNLYPRRQLKVSQPNTFVTLDINGESVQMISPENFDDLLNAFNQ